MQPTEPPANRSGKIARLPAALRAQLNRRLDDNEPAPSLLQWLNALPETRQVLRQQFHDAPISPQNLSEWRQGGFRAWLLHEELLDHAARLHEAADGLRAQAPPEILADNLATVLAARYAALLNSWDGQVTPEFETTLRILRALTHDVLQLQKSLHRAAQQRRDLARQVKEDTALDLAQTKTATISRLKTAQRQGHLAVLHDEKTARAIAAVEIARSQDEVSDIFLRALSDQIKPDQTNPPPPAPVSAPSAISVVNPSSSPA